MAKPLLKPPGSPVPLAWPCSQREQLICELSKSCYFPPLVSIFPGQFWGNSTRPWARELFFWVSGWPYPFYSHKFSSPKIQFNWLGFSLPICNHFPGLCSLRLHRVALTGVPGVHTLFGSIYKQSPGWLLLQADPSFPWWFYQGIRRGQPCFGERGLQCSLVISPRVYWLSDISDCSGTLFYYLVLV